MNLVIYPEYIDLERWANELVGSFRQEALPILQDPNKWEEWGAAVAGTGFFSIIGLPSPFTFVKSGRESKFSDWKEWARVVYLVVNDELNTRGRNV